MSVINTNITALIGQQNLVKSQNSLQTSMQRLSSGLRINSAKDDAAGQAIANRMTSQIKGLTQAQRNANDGISVAQTAEGALNKVNDNLQRIRELTVQSQNGTNSGADLKSIQDEISLRLEEVDRISRETNFNGVKVLASNQNVDIQVGANDGEKISLNLKEITSATLGLGGFSVAKNALNVSEAITTVNIADGEAPAAVDLSSVASDLGVDAGSLTLHNVREADGTATDIYAVKSGNDYYAVSVDAESGAVELNLAQVQFTDADNGVVDEVDLEDQFIKVGADSAGNAVGYINIQGKNFELEADTLVNGGSAGTDHTNATVIALSGATPTAEFAGAATANPLSILDNALNTVDSLRSQLGAAQNRFEAAIDNLSTTTTNLSAARSRIEDADYAVEVSNMTRAQILQQAGTSVLAQANQVPQSVLSLLR